MERERRTLDRALARTGLCSRSKAREWIAAGRVRVGGRRVLDPDTWIDARSDALELDGVPVAAGPRRVLALHKPVGYLVSQLKLA